MPLDRLGLGKVMFPASTEKDLRVALDDFATKVDDNLNYILPAVITHTGPQGIQGVKGDKGDKGDSGAPGADGADGIMASIVAGTNVTVDDTDPANPIVASTTPKATGADIDTGTEDAEFVTPKAIADSALVSETAWTDYSAVSTIVGWASFTTKKIYTKKIGKTVFVSFKLTGTSDSTYTTFTLPYVSANGESAISVAAACVDNGSVLATPSLIAMPSGGAIVYIGKDSAATVTAWTASNSKQVWGQFFYEAE